MNIRILQAIETHNQRGEIAQAFAQKWANALDGIFVGFFPDSLTLNIPTDYSNRKAIKDKIGDLFGVGGWNQERGTIHWHKVVDGVTVKLLNVAGDEAHIP